MKHLPIFLNIRDKPCLVVGAGRIAARKIELLLKAGADVSVVANDIGSEVSELEKQGTIHCQLKNYEPADLNGAKLVIAATSDAELNAEISTMAQAIDIPVNVVDNPTLCSFLVPSIIDRNPIQIAISTGGASPVLARLIKSKLESSIPLAYGELAKLAKKYRKNVKQAFAKLDLRRRFLE
jgi:uroporphyrin-III C-methyltransferase/precorrin-2 dehydrogenase/sirohydrochlorin ferrochelatase